MPEITGRAWITGMGQYLLADDDPFPAGFAWDEAAPDVVVVGAGIVGDRDRVGARPARRVR